MKTKIFPVNPFEMNCYVYHDENSGEGVIIDPGAYTHDEKSEILEYIHSNNITIKYIINTHGHIDHIMGNKWAKDEFGAPLLMNKEDMPLLKKSVEQRSMYGIAVPNSPDPDRYLCEGDTVTFGDCSFSILYTPGHSPGSVCLVDEKSKTIFAGDVIFHNSIGRTDLWMGDMDTLISSIKDKLFKYPDDFTLYPGHYEQTTIGEEKTFNPFLK
jgi:hydroxyacylglutathione hydrolase